MVATTNYPEDSLDVFWLCVWRNLVEQHWNFVRDYDDYSYASYRKCRSKESVDKDVADLAQNYWERNRFRLKEWFLNYTCDKWPDSAKFEIERAVSGDNWLQCNDDPCYPFNPNAENPYDAKTMEGCGWFTRELKSAMSKAKHDAFDIYSKKLISEFKKIDEQEQLEKKQARLIVFQKVKTRFKLFFKKIAYLFSKQTHLV